MALHVPRSRVPDPSPYGAPGATQVDLCNNTRVYGMLGDDFRAALPGEGMVPVMTTSGVATTSTQAHNNMG